MKSEIASMGKICIDLIYSDVERIPQLGEEVFSKGFAFELGGGPPATLINLHRLGIPVRLGTFLGKGQLSKFAGDKLAGYGVNYTNLYAGEIEEPLIISSVISTGEDRSFVSYQPENNPRKMFDLTEAEVYEHYKGAPISYVVLGYDEVWKKLKKEGSILVMDTAWFDDLSMDWYKDVFPYIDYFTPNEKEAPKLTGTKTPEEALDFLAEYIANPIVKLGKDGCILKEKGKTLHLRTNNQFKNVDSTGAGDAFLAGLMYGIYKGYSVKEAAALGNITGGNAVTQIGCLTASLNEEKLLNYYKAEG